MPHIATMVGPVRWKCPLCREWFAPLNSTCRNCPSCVEKRTRTQRQKDLQRRHESAKKPKTKRNLNNVSLDEKSEIASGMSQIYDRLGIGPCGPVTVYDRKSPEFQLLAIQIMARDFGVTPGHIR